MPRLPARGQPEQRDSAVQVDASSLLPASLGVAAYALPLVMLTAGYALFQAANNTAMTAACITNATATYINAQGYQDATVELLNAGLTAADEIVDALGIVITDAAGVAITQAAA